MDIASKSDDPVVLITGASRGLGRAMCELFAASGYRVAVVDVNAPEEPLGAPHRFYEHDLTDHAGTALLPSRIVNDLGRLDVLVNNAGYRQVVRLQDHSTEAWQRAIDINLTAPFVLIRESIPYLAMRPGSIVNIASVAAGLSFNDRAAYNASKAGVLGLTRAVARELGPTGIRCNAVSPGVIRTSMSEENLRREGIAELVADSTPLGGPGEPADIARAVLYLASDDAKFMTGSDVVVDGGWAAGKGF